MEFFFVGSATHALFNENILLNDVASDIQTNDTSLPNNQPNIQNNQSSNIISGENSNSIHNNMANVVLNVISGINDNGIVNDDVGQKVVKEVSRITANDGIHIVYDDSSYVVVRDNQIYQFRNVLMPYDTDSISGGYIRCADCGNFIPVGNVSGLVPEDYLCDCSAYIMNIKDVPWVYSEESVLENVKNNELWFSRNNDKVLNNTSNVDSPNRDNNSIIINSDDINQSTANLNRPIAPSAEELQKEIEQRNEKIEQKSKEIEKYFR